MPAPALVPASPPFLGYGRQLIEEDDIAAVTAVLRSEHLAHGPAVDRFEQALAGACGAGEAVACASGTAALQLALASLDVGPGDLCVVPAITFLSTATAARLLGAEVRFADVDADTGLMTPQTLAAALDDGARVKVVLPVHLGGRLCEMEGLSPLAGRPARPWWRTPATPSAAGTRRGGRSAPAPARTPPASRSIP